MSLEAGGGSIAYVAQATGASVVLGHLPPRLLGGEIELDIDAAQAAIATVAEPLGLTPQAAARGIVDLVNEAMLGALRGPASLTGPET